MFIYYNRFSLFLSRSKTGKIIFLTVKTSVFILAVKLAQHKYEAMIGLVGVFTRKLDISHASCVNAFPTQHICNTISSKIDKNDF